ncbi:uncharacterized protein FIBRA_08490 [Fibroporia radiculosa]|uniref:Uncharacterized protein n=1 Tax=Fibroporia radiculosa TaxID=599839 RepID=J4ICD9_9APHY|nr:uncharacterized protein FIBRA_08490 [Fibroporia radiculosa]CCM06241.1 predicted protein [Fibroporia radiculosa]
MAIPGGLWVDPELATGPHSLEVDAVGRHYSDHCVLSWDLAVDPAPPGAARLPRTGATTQKYIDAVTLRLLQFPTVFATTEEVLNTVATIEDALNGLWSEYAEVPCPCARSKTWWNGRCKRAADRVRRRMADADEARWEYRSSAGLQGHLHPASTALRAEWGRLQQDLKDSRKDLSKAVKATKREFFDACMKRSNPKLISDFVAWTKPRRQSANVQLKMKDGSAADDPDRVSWAFQEQFTPANPKPVDMRVVEQMSQWPERDFVSFSKLELEEALATMSNT